MLLLICAGFFVGGGMFGFLVGRGTAPAFRAPWERPVRTVAPQLRGALARRPVRPNVRRQAMPRIDPHDAA